jgi:hypothetical protein
MNKFSRLPFLALAILGLLGALWAGLLRLGWGWPAWQPALPMAHGPLMIGGFLGTLISLERAVALERRWGYLAPLFTGLGGIGLLFGLPQELAALLITLGSAVLVGLIYQIWRIHAALYTSVIGLGVLAWLIGNMLWLAGQPLATVTAWWIGFLVLTIAGDRLELSRLLRLSQVTYAAFGGCTILLLLGLLVVPFNLAVGMQLLGSGLVAVAIWLLRYDIAWRRIKAGGQARFIAFSLLSGYSWLVIAGGLAIRYGGIMAGPFYDAMLHACFLGFVITMIFAHAPIIFPAVLKIAMVYTPRFYLHLFLLHLTLALRLSGDLLLWPTGRLWGGLLNGVVLLLFLANTIIALKRPGTPV